MCCPFNHLKPTQIIRIWGVSQTCNRLMMFLPLETHCLVTDPSIASITLNTAQQYQCIPYKVHCFQRMHTEIWQQPPTKLMHALAFVKNILKKHVVSPPCFHRSLNTGHLHTSTRSPNRLNARSESYMQLIHHAFKTPPFFFRVNMCDAKMWLTLSPSFPTCVH